jgi:hypothetical protein
MMLYSPNLLTPEEFASLLELAISGPQTTIPAAHQSRLIACGYLVQTQRGLLVTGDGLLRITESE